MSETESAVDVELSATGSPEAAQLDQRTRSGEVALLRDAPPVAEKNGHALAPGDAVDRAPRRLVKVLRRGDKIFESTGYSTIKVSRAGDDGETTVGELLTFPIRSRGIAEVMDRLRDSAPKPPYTRQLILKDSPEGRDFKTGWQGDKRDRQWVFMADTSDKDYLVALEEHQTVLVMETINQGLDVEILDTDDRPITNSEQKLEALKEMGLTTSQFSQLVEDITALTTISETDREAFSARPSAAAPSPPTR